ncbi:PIN/TRAM domain-containing protein [Anaerovibrio sp.]|uniref:PIN/TRAM domain-containing protein n=1 Tax=Anaerovibrio sp. TaxID=1872532 RepID=UPI003F1504EB
MLVKVIRFFVTALLAVIGGVIVHLASPVLTELISTEVLKTSMGIYKLTIANVILIALGMAVGAAVGYLISPFVASTLQRFSVWVEGQLSKMPLQDVIAGVAGLAIGLIIANLLGGAFSNIPVVGDYIPVVFSIVFGYLGIHIVVRKQKEIGELLSRMLKLKKKPKGQASELVSGDGSLPGAGGGQPEGALGQSGAASHVSSVGCKLLDTSVIIDGRIADICRTGFIDGKLLIPVFVLEELQHIADSADALKRVRGRRGLDILQRIRTESGMQVEIINHDFDDITEVDSKLVRLGQQLGGKIITNDYNLNKVSELQGVPVLNINDLSNAVKPVVIPGESMHVTIVKEGKEHGQGVAYLDDGTMIVVENGRYHLNEAIQVEVTSALQTSAGRMIFAKPVTA